MIATWGWLMIGNVCVVPNGPMFVIVNVPPTISSGPSCFDFAAGREIADLAGDQPQALAVGVADHRRDQALELEVDGDAEVDVAVHDERLALDARVHVRVVVHDVAERTGDEREVREREALFGLPLRLVRAAHALDPLEVDAHRRVDVRAGRERPHHVLGRAPADVVERHDLVAGARAATGAATRCAGAAAAGAGAGGGRGAGAGPRARRRVEHVVAGDAAAFAGAADLRPGRDPARR